MGVETGEGGACMVGRLEYGMGGGEEGMMDRVGVRYEILGC